jgi:hypothetical protein
MSPDRINYFAWAMVVMLGITTISMIDTWHSSATTKNRADHVTAPRAPRTYTNTSLKVPPPGLPIHSRSYPLEENEQAQRANDSTAAALQAQCWKFAGGDLKRQSKDRFCLDYHAYVNYGIMPLAPVRLAVR